MGFDCESSSSRHELYEIFYSGDPVRAYAAQYLGYDQTRLTDPVWKLIGQPLNEVSAR